MITRPVLVRACNDTLRATNALSLSANQSSWVEPGLVKLIYSPHISTSQLLTDTLTQLVLANAGLTEADAPWLWRGLPLVLQKRADRIATQTKLLPPLQTALTNDALTPQAAFDWGVAVLLALAQHWQEIGYQPKRSILFAAWGAQEMSQLGSSTFVMTPTQPLTQFIAVQAKRLQQDWYYATLSLLIAMRVKSS